MATVAERAKSLRSEIGTHFSALVSAIVRRDLDEQELVEAALVSEIEQALLAERRLARIETFEEAAKIAESLYDKTYWDDPSAGIAARLRAAAEKEVVTK